MNKNGFAISGIIYSILILFLILMFGVLSILGSRKLVLDKMKNDVMNELNGEQLALENQPNAPELLDNMIPIKYDGTNWTTVVGNESWYNYNNKEWANAVVVKNENVIKDFSDHHNDIAITDKYTVQNGMAYFDGVDDYIDLGYKSYDFGDTASMVLRFKLHSVGNYTNHFFGNWEGAGFGLATDASMILRFSMYDTTISNYKIVYGPVLELEKWYTVVATYGQNKLKLYVNGELVGTTDITVLNRTSPIQFVLGANPGGNDRTSEFTNFTVSDAMLYDRILSEEEVKNSFSKEITSYSKVDLLFGYNYFGSSKGYYETAKQNVVISEDDIDLWYVWIPRYKYTIFNGNNGSINPQEIKIEFESGINSTGTVKCSDAINKTDGVGNLISETCKDEKNGYIINGKSTYTHPAFTFGNQELTGFWVGKFEITGISDQLTIKPNQVRYSGQSLFTFFNLIRNMEKVYNFSDANSHMIKNMEWGAIAFLSHSKYGTCANGSCREVGMNNNSNYITGCGANPGSDSSSVCNSYNTKLGMSASTTGNIYGVYDMNGGSWEYVMGNMVNESGNFNIGSSGFVTAPETKYYDSYSYSSTFLLSHRTKSKLGDNMKETLKESNITPGAGWYGDNFVFTDQNNVWFARGGRLINKDVAGIFAYGPHNGGCCFASRAVLVNNY